MNVTELGLLGYPLRHSLSPFIHEEIMAAAGLAGRYRLFEIEPAQVDQNIGGLLKGLAGYNCTIP